jgi:hypothetical protein
MARYRHSEIETEQRGSMVWAICDHGPNDTDVIDSFSQVRKNVTDFNPALPVLFELERRLHQIASTAFRLGIATRSWLPVILVQHRFWIEGVDVRRTARHEQINDVFGLWREVRPRSSRPGRGRACFSKESRQSHSSESISQNLKCLPTIHYQSPKENKSF